MLPHSSLWAAFVWEQSLHVFSLGRAIHILALSSGTRMRVLLHTKEST